MLPDEKGEFTVRLHHANRAGTHHDLHLNGDSWALPKLMPRNHGEKRLAIRTAYHNMEERRFSGTIVQGYGKGTSDVIDEGDLIMITEKPSKKFFTLHGDIFKGNYRLIQTPSYGKNMWLLIKQ